MSINDVWIVMTQSRPLSGCEIDFYGCELTLDSPTNLDGEILASRRSGELK